MAARRTGVRRAGSSSNAALRLFALAVAGSLILGPGGALAQYAAPKPAAAATTAAARPAAGAAAAAAAPKPAARGAAAAAAPKPALVLSPGALQAPPSKPPNTLRIGVIVPLTGPKADTGKAVLAGVEIAAKLAAPKRVPGVKVEVLPVDTQCEDVPALRAAAKLARVNNVDAMIGDVCSSATLAATAVANKYQIPLVSPAASSTSLTHGDDYFFRTVPSDRFQGQYAAAKMTELGLKRVVVAYGDSSYGHSLGFSFIAAFTRDGGRAFPLIVPRAGAEVAAVNASTVVAEAKRTGADGVFLATNAVQFMGDVIKAIRAARLPVTIFGGDSMMDPAVAAAAGGAAALGVRGSDVSFGAPEFVRAFKEHTAGKVPYQAKAAHAFDAAVALMDAYRRAPPPKSGAQVAAELRNVKFQGKSGPVAFDEYGDLVFNPGTSYNVLEFDRDGQIRVLEA